jgi:hypothetical protein
MWQRNVAEEETSDEDDPIATSSTEHSPAKTSLVQNAVSIPNTSSNPDDVADSGIEPLIEHQTRVWHPTRGR